MSWILRIGLFLLVGAFVGMTAISSSRTVDAAAPTLFCTLTDWEELTFPYGVVLLEYRPCSYYPVRFGVPIGEIGEFGVCDVRPSLTTNADFLDCLWHGYYDWPEDIVERMYTTRGQYACLITDHQLFRGQYLAMLACGERTAFLRALYGL